MSNLNSNILTYDNNELSYRKQHTHILFIKNDTDCEIIKSLRESGWIYINVVKDINSIDSQNVIESDILFIDIQDVGKTMMFCDEGLGIALAIKETYPEKRVVIYSKKTILERFDMALSKSDYFLSKNAYPYIFTLL